MASSSDEEGGFLDDDFAEAGEAEESKPLSKRALKKAKRMQAKVRAHGCLLLGRASNPLSSLFFFVLPQWVDEQREKTCLTGAVLPVRGWSSWRCAQLRPIVPAQQQSASVTKRGRSAPLTSMPAQPSVFGKRTVCVSIFSEPRRRRKTCGSALTRATQTTCGACVPFTAEACGTDCLDVRVCSLLASLQRCRCALLLVVCVVVQHTQSLVHTCMPDHWKRAATCCRCPCIHSQ